MIKGFVGFPPDNRVRIAVVGDSMSAQSYAWADMWPERLSVILNQNGVPANVKTFAVNAHSFYRLNNSAVFDTLTCVDAAIAFKPHVVIVVCGHNDTVSNVDSRNITQIQADALETFETLRAALPNAEIYYGAQIAHDDVNFSAATLKNKGVAPQYMALKPSGILQDLYTSEMLDDDCSSATRTAYGNWETLDAYIKALDEIDGYFDIQAWKVARLGLLITDGLHFNAEGHQLLAASVMDGLLGLSTAAPFLAKLSDQLVASWTSFDTLFADYLTDDGDGWTAAQPDDDEGAGTDSNLGMRIMPNTWFMPYKADFRFVNTSLANSSTSAASMYHWYITNAKPLTAVENSVNGGAFSSAGVTTDQHGYAEDLKSAGVLGIPDDTYTFRFKVGNMVFDPVEITLTTP